MVSLDVTWLPNCSATFPVFAVWCFFASLALLILRRFEILLFFFLAVLSTVPRCTLIGHLVGPLDNPRQPYGFSRAACLDNPRQPYGFSRAA